MRYTDPDKKKYCKFCGRVLVKLADGSYRAQDGMHIPCAKKQEKIARDLGNYSNVRGS